MAYVSPVQIAPVVIPTIRPAGAPSGAERFRAAEPNRTNGEVTEVASRRTPMSLGGIRHSLAVAYRRSTGETIPNKTLDILAAHVAHETARGDRMFNFNFGGIKGAGPSGLSARYQTTEVFDGQTKKLVDGFRAYSSADEGAADYLKLLRERFPGALREAKAGDVSQFAASLKQSGYFTADLAAYTRALEGNLHAGVGGLRGLLASAPIHRPTAQLDSPGGSSMFLGPRSAPAGGSYLYGRELAAESLRLDGFTGGTLPTSLEVARVVGAMNSLTARIAQPIDGDPSRSPERPEPAA